MGNSIPSLSHSSVRMMPPPNLSCDRPGAEAHTHFLHSIDEGRPQSAWWRGELDVVHAHEDTPKDFVQLQACQCCPETIMLADTERQMVVRIAADVEGVRSIEDLFVAVRRRVPNDELLVLSDLLAANFRVGGALTAEIVDGGRIAQDFFDGRGEQ